jgi:hypothetical protein
LPKSSGVRWLLPIFKRSTLRRTRQNSSRNARQSVRIVREPTQSASQVAPIVRRNPSLRLRVERNEQWIVVDSGHEQLSVPAFLRRATDKLLGDEAFAVQDLDGVATASGKVALVRRFLEAGFVPIVSSNAGQQEAAAITTDTLGRTYAERGIEEHLPG